MKIYAVYKGDKYLTQGTIKELANYFKVKESTVRFWSYPTQKKRDKGNMKIAIKILEDTIELED